jgi:glycosyltransferase involved in cell wall biosynthesis
MSASVSPLLSVIVPVAMGREPYTRLFTWLPLAEGRNLEIILVLDQFSHQASPEFLNSAKPLISPRFKVVSGAFGSPGGARNFGLAEATGDWVAFWDSDDLPNLENFLEMVDRAHSQQCQVAVGSFTWQSEIHAQEFKSYVNPGTIDQLIQSVGRTPGIWRFAVKRRSLVSPFSTLQMAEDQDFLLANKYLSRKVFISTEEVYEYFTGSEMHQTSSPANFKDLRRALNLTYQHFTSADDAKLRKLAALFWLQQFGSNLKYGLGINRIKTLSDGIQQILFSSFEFKRLISSSFVGLIRSRQSGREDYKVIVPLTGGLGNQLFQLSAALALADGAKVGLNSSIGTPRVNAHGEAEIASFELPNNVSLLPTSNRSKLLKKSSGYLLRIGVSPRNFERSALYQGIFKILWNIVTALSVKRLVITTSGKGVGYFELKKLKMKQFIYGYFQSYKWPEQSIVQLREIKPLNDSAELKAYRELAVVESPLIVHIRLGDYKSENNFGIPSKRYYSDAISQLWGSGQYKKIWVFSDDPETAATHLPPQYLSVMRWVPEIDSSATQTLEAMRLGKGYVIGNSTFSWWGAFLAYNSKVQVIAPRPWFKFGESPQALIPPGWKQIDAFKD